MKTIEELRARQDEIRSRLKELDSEFAGQEMTTEARSEWERIEGEFEKNSATLTELEFRRERVEELAGNEENREESRASFQTARPGSTRGDDFWDMSNIRASVSNPQEATRQLRDNALRAIEQASFAHEKADKERTQTHIERLQEKLDGESGEFSRHLLATGNPTYRSAFLKAIAQKPLGPEEQRALSLTGEKGGYLLPFTLDPTIIPTSNGTRNPLRAISKEVQTTTNEWKGVSSGGGEAKYREAEGEETTDDSPKFAQPEIACHAADYFAQWSYEFGQDYGSINTELATIAQQAKDDLEATKFASGSGEKEPYGVLTGATEVVKTGEEGKFAVADLYKLEEALADTRFGVNARFVGKRGIYNITRQFDTAGGANLWVRLAEGFARQSDGALGQGLLGYQTYELSTMGSKVEKGKTILLFGDFDYYTIADRIGMTAKPIDNIPGDNGRPTGQAGLYFFWRNGAKVMSKAAFRKLEVA